MSVEHASNGKDGLHWRKSSYSGSGGGNCVEVASDLAAVYVRDSKIVGSEPMLRIARANWSSFVFATANAGQDL